MTDKDGKCMNEVCGCWADSPQNNNCHLEWHCSRENINLSDCEHFTTTPTESITTEWLKELEEIDSRYLKMSEYYSGLGNWLSEVLTDFRIGHDNHIQGKKIALTQFMAGQQATITALQERIAELEKDRERLETLQENESGYWFTRGKEVVITLSSFCTDVMVFNGRTLREAIDKAIKASK